MKYRNASEILPDSLLRELQKYASGELLYIPADSGRKNGANAPGRVPFIRNATRKSATGIFISKFPSRRSARSTAFPLRPCGRSSTGEEALVL